MILNTNDVVILLDQIMIQDRKKQLEVFVEEKQDDQVKLTFQLNLKIVLLIE